jgi:hypothetical protein
MPKRTPVNVDLRADYPLNPSTIEDIDYALYKYLDEGLNISCETNEGFRKVPIIYALPERAYQIKNDPNLRPDGRMLDYPLISLVRRDILKNPSNKGRYGVYIPPYFEFYKKGGAISIMRQVKQDKTRNFANATSIKRFGDKTNSTYSTFPFENKKIVYESLYIPTPTFLEITYEIKMISNYQQQMNEMVSPLLSNFSTPAVFSIEHNGNRYEAFVDQSVSNEGNNAGLDTEERVFKSTITIKVLGHIIGADKNQETPAVTTRESAAQVTIGREKVVVGDKPNFNAGRKDKYRR